MSRERWQRVKGLFQAAISLEDEARTEFLARLEAEAPDEAAEVESLLAAHEEPEGPLDRPPSRMAASALAEAELSGEAGEDEAETKVSSLEGRRIGPYRIVRRLGRGGLGTVYLATRQEEYHKEVAIKLIRRTAASRQLSHRFEVERQILANFDHPNIARLLDGGTTEDGLPYLVMEYVEGLPIDRYCDENRLTVRRRLELFVGVCEAVAAAHRGLIVHCDIKPDNVLVAADGSPKLLDFGIAKLLGSTTGSADERSASEARILTPDYASPEQLRGDPVTTASDVYSLGVLLFELLTGWRPHSVGKLSLDEAARVVSGGSPRRPSTVPETGSRGPAAELGGERAALQLAAEARATTPRRLRRQLAGDLDSIVLRALEAAAASRYGSVEQLAADVNRYLEGLPVLARGGGFGYRMARFVGRYRLAVSSAAAVVLTILGFLALLAVQSVRLASARDRAEDEAAAARTVSGFLQEMLTRADPFEGMGGEATVVEALDRAVAEIGTSFRGRPALEADVRHAAGMTYLGLGRFGEAEPQLVRSLELRRLSKRNEPSGLARSLTAVGRLRQELGAYEEAEGHYREALEAARGGLAPQPRLVAEIVARLATVRHDQGDLAEAEALYREALEMRRAVLGPEGPEVASSLEDLANLLQQNEELEAAEELYREALAMRRRHLEPGHPDISSSLNGLASVLHDRDQLEEAGELYRRSLRMAEERFVDDHPEVAVAINNLATLLHDQGELEKAESRYREALAMTRRIYGERHPEVAISLGNLADLLHDQGNLDAAERLYRQSLAMEREFLGDTHPDVALSLESLSILLEERGDLAAAEAAMLEALETNRRVYGDDGPDVAWNLADLGSLACLQGQPEKASELFARAIGLLERIEGEEELIAELRVEAEECARPASR